MSSNGWREALRQMLTQANERLAIVAVGNELRGDDAVGVYIIHRLQRDLPPSDDLLLLDAGSAPENITGILRQFEPATVLLIDAVDMDLRPGVIYLLDLNQDIVERIASTHTISLNLLAIYLRDTLDCSLHLLAIQPEQLNLNAPLSDAVQASMERIVNTCLNAFI